MIDYRTFMTIVLGAAQSLLSVGRAGRRASPPHHATRTAAGAGRCPARHHLRVRPVPDRVHSPGPGADGPGPAPPAPGDPPPPGTPAAMAGSDQRLLVRSSGVLLAGQLGLGGVGLGAGFVAFGAQPGGTRRRRTRPHRLGLIRTARSASVVKWSFDDMRRPPPSDRADHGNRRLDPMPSDPS
jgi:hypothetical protein